MINNKDTDDDNNNLKNTHTPNKNINNDTPKTENKTHINTSSKFNINTQKYDLKQYTKTLIHLLKNEDQNVVLIKALKNEIRNIVEKKKSSLEELSEDADIRKDLPNVCPW